ncbi:MAG: hypothetical protein WBD47_06410 [Phormidesmis sp.]
MAIYQVCKAVLTSVAIASAAVITTSCSGGHSAHLESNAQEGRESTATDVLASETAAAQTAEETDGSAPHSEMDHSEMEQGEATDHSDHHDKTLEIPAGVPVPSVTIQVDADEVRGWNLQVETTDFTLAPEKVNGESSPNEGHAHLYINDEPMQRIYSNWTHLLTLPAGETEVRVTLNANGHETLSTEGNPIEDTVVVEVPPSAPAN